MKTSYRRQVPLRVASRLGGPLSVTPAAVVMAGEADPGAALERCERLLRAHPGPWERFRIHKWMGQLLDNLGRFPEVFPHLHRAANVSLALPRIQNQDRSFVPALIESYHEGLVTDTLSRCSRLNLAAESPAPVFLAGFTGSGAGRVRRILETSPEVFVADEPGFMTAVRRRIDHDARRVPARLAAMGHDEIAALRRFYWECWCERYGDAAAGKLCVDKSVMNSIDLGLINCLFPDAKVVFMVRDPRDVILDCYFRILEPTEATVHLYTWIGAASYFQLVMEWWRILRERLTLRWVELRHEDIVTTCDETCRWLFAFLGLGWPVAAGQPAALCRVISPGSTSVGRWRHYMGEFLALRQILGAQIEEYGWHG